MNNSWNTAARGENPNIFPIERKSRDEDIGCAKRGFLSLKKPPEHAGITKQVFEKGAVKKWSLNKERV